MITINDKVTILIEKHEYNTLEEALNILENLDNEIDAICTDYAEGHLFDEDKEPEDIVVLKDAQTRENFDIHKLAEARATLDMFLGR